MTWKQRAGGSWNQPTIKRRKDGQWVTISGGSGGGGGGGTTGERWYTDGPPTRSGGEILYPDDGHSSLQAAFNSLNSGDTLTITQDVDGERLHLHDSGVPDGGITMQGDGSMPFIRAPSNTNSRYTVGSEASDFTYSNYYHAVDSLGGSASKGDTAVPVTDAQTNFVDLGVSAGDSIYVWEDLYPEEMDEKSKTFEHAIIESIDTSNDVIHVEDPLWFNYPNNNTSEVGTKSWLIDDFVIRNLEIHNHEGLGDNTWPFRPHFIRWMWIENVAFRHASQKGNLVRMESCHKTSWNDVEVTDGSQYGLQPGDGSTDTYVNNLEGRRIRAYVYRAGPPTRTSRAPAPAGGLVQNVSGYDTGQFVFNNHKGGYYQTAEGIHAEGARTGRFRSLGIEMYDTFETGNDNYSFVYAQRPHECILDGEGTSPNVTNKQTNHEVFWFHLDVVGRNDYGKNITIRNMDIDAYQGLGPGDIGAFDVDETGGTRIDGTLHFDHVTYDGNYLTQSDIESWDGFAEATIENFVVDP